MALETLLREGFAELGLPLDGQMLARFERYYLYLEEQNALMNLTAIRGEEDTARLHFLDCAALLRYTELSGKRCIDVGTGAGFPGLVLKIASPQTELTLLDSLDKRVGFLRRLCEGLELDGVECLHARAEEAAHERRESYDYAFSRAVAQLELLSELCLPFVRPGGAFVAMKGPQPEEEIQRAERAITLLGGRLERCERYRIPGSDAIHSAVIVRKERPTPPNYPRRWAQIKKAPL